MSKESLNAREWRVLESVIEAYVETAEPAGSRTIAKRCGLGVSPATIRNTMSDLEDRGYLYHTHSSGGRIPTDLAYRAYVDSLTNSVAPPMSPEISAIREQLRIERPAIDQLLQCAAQVLGVVAQELGVAIRPSIDESKLERFQLTPSRNGRLLLVMTMEAGIVKTIFVDVPTVMAPEVVEKVAGVLNDRLSGLTLREIRGTYADRLRDAGAEPDARDLLNIFVQEADGLFREVEGDLVVLGSAQPLADQPEFASSNEGMRNLLALTEQHEMLQRTLRDRADDKLTITIGSEHIAPSLSDFTLVTSRYRSGSLSGVIGVIGPTRMPYDKIIALVDQTSRLVGELLT